MKRLKIVICTLILGLGFTAIAEEAPQPTGFSVLTVDVKPGSQQQFEAFIGKFKEAVDKVGGFNWFAESPGIGSSTTYSFARPFNSYAELADQSSPVVEAFGEEEAGKIFALFGNSVVSSSSATYHPRPDLSITNDGEGAEIVLAFSITVHPGKNAQFEDWLKKAIAAMDDRQFNTYQLGVGDGPDYAVRVLMKWADLDTQPTPLPELLANKYGKEEAARLMAANSEAVAETVQTVTRLRPDMSNPPAE